ncbi:hypothetical protein MMC13_005414 [Lambiella insularis]|nr:hypothetical protein [Lambiella insularis]
MSTRRRNSGEHPRKTVRFQRPPTEEERASLHDFVRHLKDCRRCAEALYALSGAYDLCRRGSFAAKQLFRLLEAKGEEVWSRSDHQMHDEAGRPRNPDDRLGIAPPTSRFKPLIPASAQSDVVPLLTINV